MTFLLLNECNVKHYKSKFPIDYSVRNLHKPSTGRFKQFDYVVALHSMHIVIIGYKTL